MYSKNEEEIFKSLNSSINGLDSKEAKKRLSNYGQNIILSKKKKPWILRFLKQFNDTMIIILLVVALLLYFYGYFYSHEYTDTIVILFVVFINAIVGFMQEEKAALILKDLKKYEDYKIQPISVAWQSSADVVAILKQWLISHRIYDANVISTNPKLDQVVLELKMELSTINAVITNQTDPHSQIADVIYPLLPVTTWSSPVLVNPDWPIIFSVIQEINSKEG